MKRGNIMIFKEFGDSNKPTIIFIHGGGLSDWMWHPQITAFQNDYHIVTPILDGHGEESNTVYQTISKSAKQVVTYICENCGGNVFAICGLSVGAQITVEILATANYITQKAVVESALILPSKIIAATVKPSIGLSGFLVKKRWFAKLQAKQMYLPEGMFEDYFRDSAKMKKESLINLLEDNERYTVPANLEKTTADVLVLCGAKEYKMMRQSADILHNRIRNSDLKIFPDCGHGVSLKLPQEYCKLLQAFFAS